MQELAAGVRTQLKACNLNADFLGGRTLPSYKLLLCALHNFLNFFPLKNICSWFFIVFFWGGEVAMLHSTGLIG